MHSLYCQFILLLSDVGTSFDVKKIIKIIVKVFFDLRFNSDNWVKKIFVCNMLCRDCFLGCLSFLSFLLILGLLLVLLVLGFLVFKWLFILLALGILHLRLWLLGGWFRFYFFIFFYRQFVIFCCLRLLLLFFLISKQLFIMFFDVWM